MYYATAIRENEFPEEFLIGYDNTETTTWENRIIFKTEEEGKKWAESKKAKEWINCKIEIHKEIEN